MRQLDRFRELVRRGKGRRDFDDDCSYEVRARSAGADAHRHRTGGQRGLKRYIQYGGPGASCCRSHCATGG